MNHSGELSPEWYLWYGARIGLTRNETMFLPFGELLTLIAIQQIKTEGAKRKEEMTIFEMMKVR